MENFVLNIPSELAEEIKKKKGQIEPYVLSLIKKDLAEKIEKKETYSEKDEEKVKERLRSLGYLD